MQKKSKQMWMASFLISMLTSACSDGSVVDQVTAYKNTAGRIGLNAAPTDADCARITPGDFNGFVPFPRDNLWNVNIRDHAVVANSQSKINDYVSRIGRNPSMHADFSAEYGEVYNVVDSSTQDLQMISIDQYPHESDIMPVPLPHNAVVKGGGQNCEEGSDCHLFILDRNQCWLYETWLTSNQNGRWHASNMAVWDMLKTSQRPLGWTAADAAGLSVFAGLVRYDEASRGVISHAIRFTLGHTGNSFVAPATHSAGYDTAAFPMGTRFRLKSNFDISRYSRIDQVILTAMKNYGLILADNGSELEIAGANDQRWDVADVVGLQSIRLTDFEVIDSGPAMSRADLPTGPRPEISDFTASPVSLQAGESVTLHWKGSSDAWYFIDVLGPVRGTSVTITPTASTNYTLNATNAYGRTSRSVSVELK